MEETKTKQLSIDVVKRMMTAGFADSTKTKISHAAMTVMAEILDAFMDETLKRSIFQAKERENSSVVKVDHLEKILPQLLMDFI
uniref:Centromere protein X n=1 Tax=Romanomermis culicivorax TaxID=13658 RepID=A0A915JBR1_ROMCU